MQNKKILGLDIGTNSIGGALINLPEKFEDYGKTGSIEWLGSRIIPMDGDYLQKFESGAQAETKAAFRRGKRGSRRLKHRYKLRRTRLIKVFKSLGWLDEDFPLDDSRNFKQNINENGYSLKISNYLPFSDETIKEFEKELNIENKKSKKGKSIVPEDWIVYYLRKKALERIVTIQELIRIIYALNQRRGFKSSRKDLKDTNVLPYEEFIKRKESKDFGENGIETQFVTITKIESVIFKEVKKDKKGNVVSHIYTIKAKDSRMQTWEESRKKEPDWAKEVNDNGEKIDKKEFTFLVVQKVDKNGKLSQNKPQPATENDWALCTTALSEKIQEKNQHPGEYFFDELKIAFKEKRNYKIRQYPVYRWRYQNELKAIWEKQCELNPELKKINSDKATLTKLAELLYPTQAKNNMPKLAEFNSHDLLHIISNDIIYYQRELKSQKNSISECRYEKRKGIDGEIYGLKCIPRSSPLFQDFRIWQDIHNIKILKREEKVDGKTKLDIDVSGSYINETVKEKLFDLFNSKASVSEEDILKLIKQNNEQNDILIANKGDTHSHRINLFANRDVLKGNETLSRYRSLFKKAGFDGDSILSSKEILMKLWHIDYSIISSDEEKSKKGISTALTNLLPDNSNKDNVIGLFVKLSELKKEYGSYSACAIKKLLPVMRCGKYWNENNISDLVKQRAEQIKERLESINHNFKRLFEIADDDVQKQVLKSFIEKKDLTKELNTYQAGYLIYDKHSEKNKAQIKTVEELSAYIQKEIPNNSLRNPIVEQVVRETMFLVRDVWKQYGEIDEIHIELGRDLKNSSSEREKISKSQKSNFEEKQRIKKLLYELMNDGFEQFNDEDESNPFEFKNGGFEWKTKIEKGKKFEVNPNPESPIDIDKFRMWRSLSKQSEFEWNKKVKDEKIPTEQEIKKYALWLSQNCRSPYTGKIIPLSKLFDINQYEIEHIIPRAKMKNDGFNNLVIAEWGVNKAKDKQLAANFIADSKGKCKYGNIEYKLFTYEEYDAYCKDTFKFQKSKRKNLLATEVPEDFVERQLNDTRYIGRKLAELLAPIAKNENGIIFTGGSITFELKNNWGLNKIWKDIILPRFERLEELTGKKGEYVIHGKDQYGNPVIHFNVKENPELDTKRIDHRHHALDALIIAATTREHIRYLNTLSAADTNEEVRKYRLTLVKGKIREFKEPWKDFTKAAKDKLEELVVSFKTNNKIVSQPKNRTVYFKIENGKAKKEFKEQKANPKWMSVRRSMFKEPLGVIWLKETKIVSVKEAFLIEIERQLIDNDIEKRKTASYVYDKYARQSIKAIIQHCSASIDEKDLLIEELENYLNKNSTKVESGKVNKKGKAQNKTIYLLNKIEYEKITVAYFVSYKTKRMALTKKEYVENLTIEKMKNDFPYFSENEKRNNSFNNLFLHHIMEYNNNPKEAFSTEGLEKLNKKAIENPKIGKEIKSVTRLDGKVDLEDMFNKGFYETDKGAMAYFVMYENQETKEREVFESIATHKAIEKIVKGKPIAEEREGYDKIILSPGDLVYVPTKEESEKNKAGTEIGEAIVLSDKSKISERIYQVRKFSKKQCYFLKSTISDLIIPYDSKSKIGEYGSQNLSEKSDDDIKIIDTCIKIKVDRLGNIKIANQ
jgi:CRISPR-associated endonuclease Csn1